jgi:acetoin utilization deacetylase AcuC-like enzyme
MRVVYSPRYAIDLGLHVFPTQKYQLVCRHLIEGGLIGADEVFEPTPVSWDELALVHTADYLARMRDGTMTDDDIAQLELPWSREMVDGFRVMVGGTVEAALQVSGLKSELSPPSDLRLQTSDLRAVVHIGGGLHHAFANHGEGFCPFNDVAVAIRVLQSRGVERAAVIDLDVHHGNGTAFIFESDPRVFTFSMHQQHNDPMWKPRSTLDIGLPDGVRDDTYLRELEGALPRVLGDRPGCVFYLAGADPYEDDQLGGLRLTRAGLRRRDRLVFDAVGAANAPLVVTLAGGYARRIEDTVAIHVATIEQALATRSA